MWMRYDLLLSVITVCHDDADLLSQRIPELSAMLENLVSDYEIVIIDNGSRDNSVGILESLTSRLPNLQIFCLPAPIDSDTARLVGMEQAIGDQLVLWDIERDAITAIPDMLAASHDGAEIVLADAGKTARPPQRLLYRLLSHLYIRLMRSITGFDLRSDAPRFRLMSRRTANYVLEHDNAALTYQLLPLLAGFKRTTLNVSPFDAIKPHRASLRRGMNRGLGLLVHSGPAPLRLATLMAIGTAFLSLLYSGYVLVNYLLNPKIAAGWTTLSLQISGLFFMLSIAVALLAEYVLQMGMNQGRKPNAFIAREFRSPDFSRERKLNVLKSVNAEH